MSKFQFNITIDGPVNKSLAMHLAQSILSVNGVNPQRGTAVSLGIKENGKLIYRSGIDKLGLSFTKIIDK